MIDTSTMTPFQLSKLVKDVLGVRPNTYGEKVIKVNIADGYVAVQLAKTSTVRKGRNEVTSTRTVVKVWERTGCGWKLLDSVKGDETSQTVLAFDCPTTQERTTQRAHETLGRPYDRDGYRRPIPQGV